MDEERVWMGGESEGERRTQRKEGSFECSREEISGERKKKNLRRVPLCGHKDKAKEGSVKTKDPSGLPSPLHRGPVVQAETPVLPVSSEPGRQRSGTVGCCRGGGLRGRREGNGSSEVGLGVSESRSLYLPENNLGSGSLPVPERTSLCPPSPSTAP